jgi:phosphate transport system protein
MLRDAFHREVRELEEEVIQMASLVEGAIARAMQALLHHNSILADDVRQSDSVINDLQRTIRNRCIGIMARQAPVACDLRELTTIQLVINELERMGDHAVTIARQVHRIPVMRPLPMLGDLSEMAKLVQAQVRAGIQTFIDVNVQAAREVCAKDDEIDQLHSTIFTDLLERITEDPTIVQLAASLLFVTHDLERIGDRVTNVCEDVIYMVSGEIEELN